MIAAINVIAADSMEEAAFISASHLHVYIDIYTKNLSQLIPSTKDFLESLSQFELEILHHRLIYRQGGRRNNSPGHYQLPTDVRSR